MLTDKELWYIFHQDTDPPLSILDESINDLSRLVLEPKKFVKQLESRYPFWTKEDAEEATKRAISQTIREIKDTLDVIEKHGNKWVYEEEVTPCPCLFGSMRQAHDSIRESCDHSRHH